MNFQVETTSHCNLTCGYCPNRNMVRERTFISDEVWDAVLHKYVVPFRHINAFTPPTFLPHKDGEILLNKRLPDRLLDLSVAAPDMKIDIYSHGLMLPTLAKAGRDFFEFLSTLPNQVRYMMSYHPRNHDDSVNDYTQTIIYLRNVLRDPPKNVEFITVSHKSKWVPESDQLSWKAMWTGLPITVHCNTSINPWTGLMEDVATCHYNGCPYADFGHWFFGVTGNVIACCLDLEEEIILGNVLHDDPAEMFTKTEAFYAEQRRILDAKELHPRGVWRNCFGQKRDDNSLLQLDLGRMTMTEGEQADRDMSGE